MNLEKIIKNKYILIFAVLVLGTVIYVIASFFGDTTPPLVSLPTRSVASPTPTPIRSEMYTQPLSIETGVGKRFDIDITIDAKNTVVNGIDSVITYDPTILRVVRISPADNKIFSLLRKQVEDGKLIVTAIKNQATDTPTQEQIVARVSIQALKSGTTTLIFEHKPGTTTGSTIIQAEGSKNILDKVTNTTIIIK